jgi:hypothetical protein
MKHKEGDRVQARVNIKNSAGKVDVPKGTRGIVVVAMSTFKRYWVRFDGNSTNTYVSDDELE